MFRGKQGTLLFALALSAPLGLLVCSIYVTARHGLDSQALADFDVLAFWQETPVRLGYVSNAFRVCLMIMAVVPALALAVTAALLHKPQHFGTARWARFDEIRRAGYMRRYRDIGGPILGKTCGPRWRGSYLSYGDQPHSLVVAPTRAGKGVGVVIPTLLTFDGSVIALDVKGELFELTSRARKGRGDAVFKFSPLDRAGRTHCYNPVLDVVATPPERRFAEARRLANNLIVSKGKGAEGFIDGARDLFVAGVLACIERGTPTIGAVYDLFTSPGEKYKLFAQLAEESKVPEVTRIFDNMAGNDSKIITSYTSVLGDGGLNLWADPLIKNATSRSDFSVYDLRRDPTSIFLCVSPNDLEVIAPLVRLFFQQVVSVLQRNMPAKDEVFEVLFLLDEFKHLGKLEAIETAVTTIAGYKGRFMFIIQSLSALTGAYEQPGKENFLANSGVQIYMATADDETPQYISKAVGEYTFRNRTRSFNRREMFDANIQISNQGAPLMRPEQVRLLDNDMQIVLIKGYPPIRMHKVKYYADRCLKPIFEAQTGPLPEPDPIPFSAPETAFAPLATNDAMETVAGSAGEMAPRKEAPAKPDLSEEFDLDFERDDDLELDTDPDYDAEFEEDFDPDEEDEEDWDDNEDPNEEGMAGGGTILEISAPSRASEAGPEVLAAERDARLRQARKDQTFATQRQLLDRIIALQKRGTGALEPG